MADIKTSIDPGSQPQKDWIQAEKIEKDKRQKEELLKKEVSKKKPEVLFFAGYALYAIKILTFLATNRSKSGASLVDSTEELIKFLDGLKKTLQVLANEDVSYNPEFVQKLSDAWHDLLDALNALDGWDKRKSEEKGKIKKLLETIRLYPPKEEHNLGFYLIEFTGKNWLPFPFMHLLHTLHDEYDVLKEKSQLARWISEIDSIIQLISPKPAT